MQRPVRVVHAVAFAQRIEVVLLAGCSSRAIFQRVADVGADGIDRCQPEHAQRSRGKPTSKAALWMTSSAPRMKSRNSLATSPKRGLSAREFAADAVHRQRALVDVAIRIDVVVQVAPGQAPVPPSRRRPVR